MICQSDRCFSNHEVWCAEPPPKTPQREASWGGGGAQRARRADLVDVTTSSSDRNTQRRCFGGCSESYLQQPHQYSCSRRELRSEENQPSFCSPCTFSDNARGKHHPAPRFSFWIPLFCLSLPAGSLQHNRGCFFGKYPTCVFANPNRAIRREAAFKSRNSRTAHNETRASS